MSEHDDGPEPVEPPSPAWPVPYDSAAADTRTLVCPKCAGAMTRGFVADRSHGGSVRQSKWVEGAPEGALLGEFLSGMRTGGRVNLKIDTYRCLECGYLESYATEPAPKM